jgi:hypothetical protein
LFVGLVHVPHPAPIAAAGAVYFAGPSRPVPHPGRSIGHQLRAATFDAATAAIVIGTLRIL